jgi:FtsH-binding integral membrane protein
MTINSLLSTDKAEGGDIPVAKAEALPLKGTKYLDPKFDEESQQQPEPIATVITEATVLENLGWDKETRRIFIRKVYSILAVQLIASFAVCAFMALHQPTHVYVLTHAWPVVLSIFLSFLLIMTLMCYKDKSPQNMYLLAAFTFVEAFMVGTVTTAYAEENAGIVLEAVFLTGAIFIGLTVFTFQSKIDFSFLGAFLSMGLGALILWGFFAMLFGVGTGYVYALLGCIIFSGYILFDTWLIMDKLNPHEYVLAAIMLYLDIINLFLYILQLLAPSDDRR